MLTAAELRPGLALRIDGVLYKIIEATYHGGQGKMGGVAHLKLRNLETGTMREWRFRSEQVVEEVTPDRLNMQFLYSDDRVAYFMHPETFEQVEIEHARLGRAARFLREEMVVPVEFVDGQPLGIVFPEIVDVKVADTAPAVHAQGLTNVWKEAALDNGLTIRVPQFIAPGDWIRLKVDDAGYVERSKRK
jgi:elongation factor P